MNYASGLVKESSDVMFSIGICDSISARVRIKEVRNICDRLERSIKIMKKGGEDDE